MTTETNYSEASNPETLKNEMVKAYTQAGYMLFPITRSTKKPKEKEWQFKPFRPGLQPAELPETFGWALTPEIAVLDVDPRRYADGQDDLQDFVKQLGIPTPIETLIVRTGSGGVHICFTKPPEIKLKSKVPGFPSIDIKSGIGHYVIAAGAQHQNGEYYTIIRGSIDKLAPMPDVILKYIERTAQELSTYALDDSESTQKRFITYMKHAPQAISGQGGNNTTYMVACTGKTYGLSEDLVFRLMEEHYNGEMGKCEPEWSENELLRIVHNAFNYSRDSQGSRFAGTHFEQFAKDPAAAPDDDHVYWEYQVGREGIKTLKPVLANVLSFMRLRQMTVDQKPIENPIKGLFKYNMFSREIEFVKPAPWHHPKNPHRDWQEADAILMKGWLSDNQHFDANRYLYHEAALIEAHKQSYHPLKQELEALPKWDGVNRCEKLLTHYAGVGDNAYVRSIAVCFLVSAIARVYEPGCQHDSMIVLEGIQGIGKTKFCAILGGAFFSDMTLSPGDRDTFHGIQGKWIIEIAEMKFSREAEIDALKKFLTSKTDRARLAYETKPVDLPRQCVFIGTVNTIPGVGYLRDATGNRRFWPVYCTKMRLAELQADREQIWAEAIHRYKMGEARYLTDGAVNEFAAAEQEARRDVDSWEHSIEEWLENQDATTKDKLTTGMICYAVLGLAPSRVGQKETRRINVAMYKLGYAQCQGREGHKRVRVWRKKEIDISEI